MEKQKYTKKQVDERTSDQICWDCGKPFLTDKQRKEDWPVTAHESTCGLCGKHKAVTHYRHWNYLWIDAPHLYPQL